MSDGNVPIAKNILEQLPYNVIGLILQNANDPRLASYISELLKEKLQNLSPSQAMHIWRDLAFSCWPKVTHLMPSLQQMVDNETITEGAAWGMQVARIGTWIMDMTITLKTEAFGSTSLQPYKRYKTCNDMKQYSAGTYQTNTIQIPRVSRLSKSFVVELHFGDKIDVSYPSNIDLIIQNNPSFNKPQYDIVNNIYFPVDFLELFTAYFFPDLKFGKSLSEIDIVNVQVAAGMRLHWHKINDANLAILDEIIHS